MEPTIQHAYGYLARDAQQHLMLTDWRGKPISTNVRIVASWATPRSVISERMYQIEARVEGVLFTGRCAGIAMAWKGRPKKGTD